MSLYRHGISYLPSLCLAAGLSMEGVDDREGVSLSPLVLLDLVSLATDGDAVLAAAPFPRLFLSV